MVPVFGWAAFLYRKIDKGSRFSDTLYQVREEKLGELDEKFRAVRGGKHADDAQPKLLSQAKHALHKYSHPEKREPGVQLEDDLTSKKHKPKTP